MKTRYAVEVATKSKLTGDRYAVRSGNPQVTEHLPVTASKGIHFI
jgi:hypothetical protein